MIALLCFFLILFASPFKSKSRLEAENAALRHQLIVVQRKMRGRVRLTNGDRLFLVQLYRWFPSVLKAITIIRPETLWARSTAPSMSWCLSGRAAPPRRSIPSSLGNTATYGRGNGLKRAPYGRSVASYNRSMISAGTCEKPTATEAYPLRLGPKRRLVRPAP
jgi:hypothetical protein